MKFLLCILLLFVVYAVAHHELAGGECNIVTCTEFCTTKIDSTKKYGICVEENKCHCMDSAENSKAV
ncbi:hypothetical protein TSAR_015918 [Trichomalopsis sarcophagae]|uniref:Termicin n=1 Tax=Trichomalopsis sarcophagae TaxID=543379 RepID=A0A232EXS2_9HYME|nr:hypothetical protein TSAR_015918 [Trichomalopsis sarcophagae]